MVKTLQIKYVSQILWGFALLSNTLGFSSSLFAQSISGCNATTMKYFYNNLYTYTDLTKSLCLLCHQDL